MRRGLGRGRRGPGLLGTAARTAVIAGTATSVAGRVSANQQAAARSTPPAAAPPAAAPPSLGTDDMIAQLTRLGELRSAGVLTDEEFAAQKARILQA